MFKKFILVALAAVAINAQAADAESYMLRAHQLQEVAMHVDTTSTVLQRAQLEALTDIMRLLADQKAAAERSEALTTALQKTSAAPAEPAGIMETQAAILTQLIQLNRHLAAMRATGAVK